jgi:hypothetical protein
MRYAGVTNLDAERCFYRGAITITPGDDGAVNLVTEPNINPAAAHDFGSRAAASAFAENLSELFGLFPRHERTWFVVELPEPRP